MERLLLFAGLVLAGCYKREKEGAQR